MIPVLYHFNPRVPGGTRLEYFSLPFMEACKFQSSRPGWDATSKLTRADIYAKDISILASRVGRDFSS